MTTDTAPRTARPWVRRAVDLLASLTVVYAVGALALNKLDTVVAFLGETPSVEAYHVSDYRTWVSVLGAALLVVVLAGVSRWRTPGGRWPRRHLATVVVGLLAAAALHVSTAPADPDPEPVPASPGGGGCHSGGDSNGCVGG